MSNKHIDPRFFYQKPRAQFGQILDANKVISRDVNKDLMVHTQKISEVRMLGKSYPFQTPNPYGLRPQLRMQKY